MMRTRSNGIPEAALQLPCPEIVTKRLRLIGKCIESSDAAHNDDGLFDAVLEFVRRSSALVPYEDRDDFAQDVGLSLVEAIRKETSIQDLRSWLRAVVRNTRSDYFRLRYRMKQSTFDALASDAFEDPDSAVQSAQVEIDDVLDSVEAALRLTPNQSRILRLDAEGYKPREIARKVGKDASAVRTELHRIRRKARGVFDEPQFAEFLMSLSSRSSSMPQNPAACRRDPSVA